MLLDNKTILNKTDLLCGRFGIEKESLRITPDGTLATTPHPAVFGDRMKHPYITTDFAEAQVEIITGVHDTLEAVHEELVMINEMVLRSIGTELLWPYSMPFSVCWSDVKIAEYPDHETGHSARQYREYLHRKYGDGVQLISGIHYNFSYSESLLRKLYDVTVENFDYQTFKNNLYMKVVRNYTRYHWFLVYMLGKTPVGVGIDEPYALSLRNSKYGYQNLTDLNLSYDSLDEHIVSIRAAVAKGKIIDEREIYEPVRVKCPGKGKLLSSLAYNGIGYLEIRSLDLNPLASEGITLAELQFVHLFMLALLELPENVQFNGLAEQVALTGQVDPVLVDNVIGVMQTINDEFDLQLSLKVAGARIAKLDFLELAKQYKAVALAKLYQTHGFTDMEMSTQLVIAEAVRRGVEYKVIDRRANFLSLRGNGKLEYVKQATKTSLDTYVSYLAMENKEVTKVILKDAGFPVPTGSTFTTVEQALNCFDNFKNKEIVVKPKSTNFGWGIVMFRPLASVVEFKQALEIAFGFDEEVIVEQFLHGQEYRFLVVGDECIAVLKRVGANVVGDGVLTIAELVAKKNDHPWRGTEHRAPLEQIVLGEIELRNLAQFGYDADTVLIKEEQVFLRDNSNISTGGDSIDVTLLAADYFKDQAVAAAHAIGAQICGVDIIINGDLADANAEYGFIELNFNPAIHMHAFTLEGDGVNAAPYVLRALGLI